MSELPIVHTSDLNVYRRCKWKWDWGSYMRQNLRARSQKKPLWFGSGVHYALEDKHGLNRHGSAAQAFLDYGAAHTVEERPEDYEEMLETAKQMMEYYDLWLKDRKDFKFETYIVDGIHQNEVKFQVPILNEAGIAIAIYEGVFDGIAIDEFGRLWVKEYKTAKQFNTSKLEMDFQVTAYTWAASQIYEQPFEGVLYMQFHKTPPKKPKVLKNNDVSQNKQQRTTFKLYWDFLKKHYGGKEKVPIKQYEEFLRMLHEKDGTYGDHFIRYDLVRRSPDFLYNFERLAVYQIQEMLDKNVQLYPNPTQDCTWDCDFRDACVSKQSGYDWEQIISLNFRGRSERERSEDWRDRLIFGKLDLDSD